MKQKEQTSSDTLVLERDEVMLPRKYEIWMFNDEVTTQDFVVHVLKNFFAKPEDQAVALMLTIHTKGRALIAKYAKDLAETKVEIVCNFAKDNQMPLVLKVRPEGEE